MNKGLIIVCLIGWVLIAANNEAGADIEAEKIMRKTLENEPWETMSSTVSLQIIDSKGQVKEKKMKSISMQTKDGLTLSLMRFLSPKSAKDTGFLTLEQVNREDDMYIYLPALRKVKKITASGKGGSFMGSDFIQYDIGSRKLEDFTYGYIGEDRVNGKNCHVIKCLPVDKRFASDIGYSRIDRWIVKDEYYMLMAEFYDLAGEKVKVFTAEHSIELMGVVFVTQMNMENLATEGRSIFIFEDIETNVPVKESLFSKRSLIMGW
jgi:hypothetical protein